MPEPQIAGRSETPPASDRLDSWKEIAAYLHRGARTVQRWEREAGLPVHRLPHDKLASVYAYRSELDAWWHERGAVLDESRSPDHLETSVAVLPFADLSESRDQGWFCEGLADEIISALSRLNVIRVSSRSSSFSFAAQCAGPQEVGKRLHVEKVVEGSVRKVGARVRITVRLVDTASGFQVWADTYDRAQADILALQDDIARSVLGALEVRLAPEVRVPGAATPSFAAYECYLRGRKFYYQYGPADMDCAVQLFLSAIEIDPRFAQAYAGLADCWTYIYLYAERSPEVLNQARWAADLALEIDPQSAPALASRGLCRSAAGEDTEAEKDFETAIRLDPRLFEARYHYARHSFALGNKRKAITLYEAAMNIRPEDYQSPLLVAQSYDDLGMHDEATTSRRLGVRLAEAQLRVHPDDVRALYMAANGSAALGATQQARELARRALDLRPEDPMVLYNVGCVFSMLGSIDIALDLLAKADRNGLRQRGWYENDSNLDPLRSDPRFQQLLRDLA